MNLIQLLLLFWGWMMEKLRKKMRRGCFREVVIYFLICCMVLNTSLPAVLAEVVLQSQINGTIDVSPLGGGITQDMIVSDGAIGHFSDFDIAAGHIVNCVQNGADSNALFRVFSSDGTQILGQFNANGNVFLIDPAGILFGVNSQVNVNKLVASTLDIDDEVFLAGNYEFIAGADIGEVVNYGEINAVEGAALIGSRVLNYGTIATDSGGFVVMAAGNRVLLGEPGSKIVVEMDSVTLTDPEGFGDVVNEGAITAPGGTVVLAAGDIFSVPLHPQLKVNSGTVEAPVYDVADQPVRVESGIGTVTQSGTIKADGGSVILTAGNTTAEDGDIPDVILSAGSLTQAVGGEVITYAHDFGTKGTTTGGTTSFEDGAVINVGTGTAEISGNHVLFAGSVDALPGGTIQVDPVTLTIADTMPVTGPELDTLYEEQHVEFYSKAGVNLDLAADKLITVEYMTNSGAVGEITGGSGDIYLRNVFADGGIYFEQRDEAGHTGPRSSIRTEAYYQSAAVYRDGGSIYMDAGSGGIVAGDLKTGTKSNDKMSQPGEIVLRTANGGDIEVGTMRAEGASSTQVSAISDGDLIVNGNVESINKQTDNTETSVFSATGCLIAEGDIHLNGTNYEVYAQGKGELVSDIRISAGENVYIGSAQAPATIKAESKVAQQGIATKSTAYIVIHAGRNLSEPGVININGRSYTPGAAYSTGGVFTAVALNGGVNASNSPSSSDGTKTVWENVGNPAANFFAKIEINSKETVPLNEGPCQNCPQPPGLSPIPRLFIVADDSLTVGWAAENAPLDVLANDDNGNPLVDGIVFEHTTTTGGGILTEIRDGGKVIGFEYTPPEDAVFTWDGVSDYAEFTDTFTYKAEDSEGNVSINTATVTITATNFLPTASGDSETIHMSTAGNATSADFDLSEIIVDSDGTPGTLTLAKGNNDVVFGVASVDDSTDTATYEPFEGFVGNDDFDYTVTDSTIDYQGEPVTSATLGVTVDNTPPTGSGDLGTIHMDQTDIQTQVNLTSPVIVEDVDGVDPLSIVEDTYIGSNGGTLVYDGTDWTYTPNPATPGYVGDPDGSPDETFTIQIWDGQYNYDLDQAVTVDAQVVIELDNTLPTGSGDLGIIHMDQIDIQTQVNLTSPVSVEDVDGVDPLSIVEDTYIGSNGGTLVYDGTNWTYTPNPATPGYVGDPDGLPDETFTIQIWDSQYDYELDQAVTADAQVAVELTNVLPFAGDGIFVDKPAGVPINGDFPGYDLPDTFAEGEIDALTMTLLENGGTLNPDGTLTTALGGTVTLAPDGESFTYDPPSDSFLGPDSFTFEVWDGQRDYPIEGDPTNVTVTGTITVSFISAPTPPPAVPYMLPAPGLQREVIEISGCPALVQWVASELGTDESQIQIWMANSLASDRGIPPCDACANLKEASTVLRDVDGTRVAALAQVISQFASSTAPPTEEQMASIADAIANDIEGNRQYAAAGEYLDALAKYVGILTSEMGFSADESIQFATDNYVGQLAQGENMGVAAYVAARLAALVGSE
jgi:filamentous hemagglutinin family protein